MPAHSHGDGHCHGPEQSRSQRCSFRAAPDTAITHPNQPIDIWVVGNDTDADGDQLSVQLIVTNPTNGTVSASGGVVRYSPARASPSTDTFVYRVTDGAATSDATVTVTVLPT